MKETVYDGEHVTIAWLAGKYTAHLCAASSIRVMPETEISPAMNKSVKNGLVHSGWIFITFNLFYNHLAEVLFTSAEYLSVSKLAFVEGHLEIGDLFVVNTDAALLDSASCL